MKILIINGPNMNMLGIRNKSIYGSDTYEELIAYIGEKCAELGAEAEFFQSNHEGAIVDAIQNAYGNTDAIVINPAAYTHTSIAIADAVEAVGIPTVEVHMSDPDKRENFRKISYIRPFCIKTIKGKGKAGYAEAVEKAVRFVKNQKPFA